MATFNKKLRVLTDAENRLPECVYFIVYSQGPECIGGAVVRAGGPVSAILRAQEKGANPGGSAHPVMVGAPAIAEIRTEEYDRYLTKFETQQLIERFVILAGGTVPSRFGPN